MGGKYILKILENRKFKAISKKRFESEWKCSIIAASCRMTEFLSCLTPSLLTKMLLVKKVCM